MDKKTLNNEIVLCRAAVRKAKVAVIRKILKKMKILKTCKIETVKEKKLRKSERLFQKVQIMKKIKVDEVTKFALRNKDLEPFLQGPKVDLTQNAMACLAKHDAVVKKINSIREQIPNWETELSHLLDSLGKKNRKKLGSKKDFIKHNEKMVKKSEINKIKEKVKNDVEVPIKEKMKKPGKWTETKSETTNNDSVQSEESDCNNSEDSLNSSEKIEEVKKVIDPFFIGKKVIAPKLPLESSAGRKNKEKINNHLVREPQIKKEARSFVFDKSKKSSKFKPQVPRKVPEEEILHPSWAAKKVKLIKPFQGKKIKFSDD